MKKTILILFYLVPLLNSFGQLPDLYLYKEEEKHLAIFGEPKKVDEYYYEYRSQIRAHTYTHYFTYDTQGRVILHKKNNIGLYKELPPIFKNFTDSNAISISYTIDYNALGQFQKYEYLRTQENNPSFRIEENWKYDTYNMLEEDILMEYNGELVKMNSNSTKRQFTRDNSNNKLTQIVKFDYVFLKKSLMPYEAEVFEYQNDSIKQVNIYAINQDSISSLKEVKTNLVFKKYNDLNTDSLLLSSYTSNRSNGDTLLFTLEYDELLKPISDIGVSKNDLTDTLAYKFWIYTDSSFTKYTSKNNYRTFIYDSSGYAKTEIEYVDGYPTFKQADYMTRDFENGQLKYALVNTWESAIYIWLKDKEYLYFYDEPTGLAFDASSKTKLSIYPNPCKNWISTESDEILNIELYNLQGALVLKSEINKYQKLDLSLLEQGMYFYKFENGDQGSFLVLSSL